MIECEPLFLKKVQMFSMVLISIYPAIYYFRYLNQM